MLGLRKPGGVYVRDGMALFTPENVAVAGGAAVDPLTGGHTNWVTWCLFNNDNLGRQLDVWGWDGYNDSFLAGTWDYVTEPFGTFVSNASPVRAGDPLPPGKIYHNLTVTVNPSNFLPPDMPNPLGTISFTGQSVGPQASHPLWSLPQGFGLRFAGFGSTEFSGVSFWYTYLKVQ